MSGKLIGIVFIYAILVFLIAPVLAEESKKAGAGFPEFKLENLDGEEFTTDEIFADVDLVLIDFFTYYCKPCRKLWPQISRLQDKYGDRGFKAVMFSEDQPEGIPLLRTYLGQKNYSFIVLCDVEGEVEEFYGVRAHPTTILLDSDGNIIYQHEGYNKGDEEEIEAKIIEYLDGLEKEES